MIRTDIWYDFVNAKYLDEYICRYISMQMNIRKWFKIITLLLSGGGIWTAFESLKYYTVVALVIIAIVQLASLIESEIIHTEKQVEELRRLRILYYERMNKLERLFKAIDNGRIAEEQAEDEFFKLRDEAKAIEDLDVKLNIKAYRRLQNKANDEVHKYVNIYYGRRKETTITTDTTI